jgi:hypothetical protein
LNISIKNINPTKLKIFIFALLLLGQFALNAHVLLHDDALEPVCEVCADKRDDGDAISSIINISIAFLVFAALSSIFILLKVDYRPTSIRSRGPPSSLINIKL